MTHKWKRCGRCNTHSKIKKKYSLLTLYVFFQGFSLYTHWPLDEVGAKYGASPAEKKNAHVNTKKKKKKIDTMTHAQFSSAVSLFWSCESLMTLSGAALAAFLAPNVGTSLGGVSSMSANMSGLPEEDASQACCSHINLNFGNGQSLGVSQRQAHVAGWQNCRHSAPLDMLLDSMEHAGHCVLSLQLDNGQCTSHTKEFLYRSGMVHCNSSQSGLHVASQRGSSETYLHFAGAHTDIEMKSSSPITDDRLLWLCKSIVVIVDFFCLQ